MNYTRTVALNTVVQVVGRAVMTAVSLLTIGVLTRYLGVSGFGQFQTALSYLAIFTVLADLGFFFIIARDLSTLKTEVQKVEFVGNALSVRIIAAGVVYAAASLTSLAVYRDPVILRGIGFLALSFFALSVQNTIIAVFQSVFRMDKTVIADLVGKAVTLLLVWLAVVKNIGINGVFAAYIIGSFINTTTAIVMANKIIPIRWRFDIRVCRKILAESAPLGLAVILSTLYFKIDSVMLSIIKGSFDVGIYGVPYKVIEVVLIMPAIFSNTIIPIYSRYVKLGDRRLGGALQKTFNGLVAMAAPVVFGLMALSKEIISLIGGEQFLNASTVSVFGARATSETALKILSLAVGLGFVSQAFSYLVSAGGYQRKLILPNLFFLAFNIAANLIFIRSWSYFGAAWITVATEVLVLATMTTLCKRYFNLTVNIRQPLKMVFAGFLMYIAISSLSLGIWLSIAVGALIYFAALLLFKAVSLNDILLLTKNQPNFNSTSSLD